MKMEFAFFNQRFHIFYLIFPGCSSFVVRRSSPIVHKQLSYSEHLMNWFSAAQNIILLLWCSFTLYHWLCYYLWFESDSGNQSARNILNCIVVKLLYSIDKCAFISPISTMIRFAIFLNFFFRFVMFCFRFVVNFVLPTRRMATRHKTKKNSKIHLPNNAKENTNSEQNSQHSVSQSIVITFHSNSFSVHGSWLYNFSSTDCEWIILRFFSVFLFSCFVFFFLFCFAVKFTVL